MSIVQVSAALVVLAAALGWINKVYLKLPHSIALLVLGMAASFCVVLMDWMLPQFEAARYAHALLTSVDFFEVVMTGMLSFLLFGAAIHVDLDRMRLQRLPIILLASVGVIISTFVVGVVVWLGAPLIGTPIPFIWCLVFGALISPTDPVAVLAILKTIDVDKGLEMKIAGESLFNDGMGVVMFTVLLGIAVSFEGWESASHVVDASGSIDWWHIGQVFSVEVLGAIVFGAAAGRLVIAMMKRIDDAAVETLISLALVLGTTVLCQAFHMSGPIAVVVAGIIIGNLGSQDAMSERTKNHLFPFWTMVEEILNSVLFLLIGLEALIITFDPEHAGIALVAIPAVLLARFVSVALPIRFLSKLRHQFAKGSIRIMTWGGVRGGISVALALSLPYSDQKPMLIMATYVVVVFSIVVQGLTVGKLVNRISKEPGCMKDTSTAL